MSSKAEPPSEEKRALGRARLTEIGEAIAAAIERFGPGFLVTGSERVLDAWGRCEPDERARLDSELVAAAEVAVRRVAGEVRELSATGAARQRVTPLQLVRTLGWEPTAVLADAGIPEVVRDVFDERAAPGDRYGLAPRSLADLAADDSGEDDLGPLQLAWGLAKARALGV